MTPAWDTKGFTFRNPGSRILNLGHWIQDPACQILPTNTCSWTSVHEHHPNKVVTNKRTWFKLVPNLEMESWSEQVHMLNSRLNCKTVAAGTHSALLHVDRRQIAIDAVCTQQNMWRCIGHVNHGTKKQRQAGHTKEKTGRQKQQETMKGACKQWQIMLTAEWMVNLGG